MSTSTLTSLETGFFLYLERAIHATLFLYAKYRFACFVNLERCVIRTAGTALPGTVKVHNFMLSLLIVGILSFVINCVLFVICCQYCFFCQSKLIAKRNHVIN